MLCIDALEVFITTDSSSAVWAFSLHRAAFSCVKVICLSLWLITTMKGLYSARTSNMSVYESRSTGRSCQQTSTVHTSQTLSQSVTTDMLTQQSPHLPVNLSTTLPSTNHHWLAVVAVSAFITMKICGAMSIQYTEKDNTGLALTRIICVLVMTLSCKLEIAGIIIIQYKCIVIVIIINDCIQLSRLFSHHQLRLVTNDMLYCINSAKASSFFPASAGDSDGRIRSFNFCNLM